MGMRKIFQRKIHVGLGHRKVSLGSPMTMVFWLIVVIFLIGAFYTFGGPGDTSAGSGPEQAGTPRKVAKIVATVDGKQITRLEFDKRYMPQASDMPQAEFVTNDRYLKTQLLDGMVQRILLLDAAKKEGVSVSNADITAKVDELVEKQISTSYPNRKALAKLLQKKQKSLDALKTDMKDEMLKDRNAMRETVTFDKLKELVEGKVQISDQELQDSYTKVKARHILISPDRMKQDVEAKDKGKAPATTDYKALAKQKAEELLARIKKGEDFAALAKQFSNDPGSAAKGGMLGSSRPPAPGQPAGSADYFGRGEMVPEFDKVAFSLKPGEVSGVVETSFGDHIIQVIDRKLELPKDFNAKKEDYRKELLERRKGEAWQQYQDDIKKAATIEVKDPEIQAYRDLDENKKAEAGTLLAEALKQDPQNVGAKYQLAMLVKEGGDKDQAITLFKELVENDRASSVPSIHMQLADLYMEKKMTKEALESYKAASEWAQTYDYQSYFIHQQVQQKFTQLGDKALAKAEQDWITEFNKQQAENGGMGGLGGMGGGSMPIMPMPSQ